MSVRIGVDVGGTFTDIVCFEEERGVLSLLKVPSTPKEPHRAVIQGTQRILQERGLTSSSVKFFIHGTTVATNTLLQHRGADVALLVTEGFRDVLQIMRQDRPRLYDYFVQRPDPLVRRQLRLEVPERTLYTGSVRRPIDASTIKELTDKIADSGVRDVAVCLLHSYANPTHEQMLRSSLEQAIPDIRISLSSDILPEIREFERMSTTVVNAYVFPRVADYFQRLSDGLADSGIPSQLHIMQSNGGLIPAETAKRHCVNTILSGPAAGALSGLRLGQLARCSNLISIDVGGTSADVAVAHEGRLHFAEESEIGGQVIKIPMIEIQTVGAGGGSIAWIDPGGGLQVGPQSAGADPGPACYGTGGTEPTVTDANVVLGRVNPDYFLGGEMKIDLTRAIDAVRDKIARPLDLGIEEAAEGILRVINAVMVKAIRRLSVEKGYDPRDFVLVSFGGGGPLHAVDLALDLQIPQVLIPPAPGVSSAVGLLTADFRHDYVRTVLWQTPAHSLADLGACTETLKAQAVSQMAGEGIDRETVTYLPSVDMRYQGQGYSIEVLFTLEELKHWNSFEVLEKRFHARHEMAYGYSNAAAPTDIVNIRLVAVGALPRPELPRIARAEQGSSPTVKSRRNVYFRDKRHMVPIYERSQLRCGDRIGGPAIVEQVDSTTFFYPEQSAEVDELGNLLINTGIA